MLLAKNLHDSTALEALEHSLWDNDLFITIVTRKPWTYIQSYNICVEYVELKELKAKETREETPGKARREIIFSK